MKSTQANPLGIDKIVLNRKFSATLQDVEIFSALVQDGPFSRISLLFYWTIAQFQIYLKFVYD